MCVSEKSKANSVFSILGSIFVLIIVQQCLSWYLLSIHPLHTPLASLAPLSSYERGDDGHHPNNLCTAVSMAWAVRLLGCNGRCLYGVDFIAWSPSVWLPAYAGMTKVW